jgi:hypothetical protein
VKVLNAFNHGRLPPHKLHLETGALIMLLRDFYTNHVLCDGTKLTVKKLHGSVIHIDAVASSGC